DDLPASAINGIDTALDEPQTQELIEDGGHVRRAHLHRPSELPGLPCCCAPKRGKRAVLRQGQPAAAAHHLRQEFTQLNPGGQELDRDLTRAKAPCARLVCPAHPTPAEFTSPLARGSPRGGLGVAADPGVRYALRRPRPVG